MIARHYRELDCWQLSNELKKRIYAFLATTAVKNDFDFCKQIRGSARGATRTIAEGFGRFRPADFARYLEFARASLIETQNHLDDALDSGYLGERDHKDLFTLANRAIGATSGLHRYLKTCHPGNFRPSGNGGLTRGQRTRNPEPRKPEPTQNMEPRTKNRKRTQNREP
jgi:four helix bundle protein